MDEKKEKAIQATALVRRSYKSKDTPENIEEETRMLEVHRFITTPAEVGYGIGLTMNMGNFESARVDVSIKMPCYVEEIDVTYRRVQAWAEKLLVEERDKIKDIKKNPF